MSDLSLAQSLPFLQRPTELTPPTLDGLRSLLSRIAPRDMTTADERKLHNSRSAALTAMTELVHLQKQPTLTEIGTLQTTAYLKDMADYTRMCSQYDTDWWKHCAQRRAGTIWMEMFQDYVDPSSSVINSSQLQDQKTSIEKLDKTLGALILNDIPGLPMREFCDLLSSARDEMSTLRHRTDSTFPFHHLVLEPLKTKLMAAVAKDWSTSNGEVEKFISRANPKETS